MGIIKKISRKYLTRVEKCFVESNTKPANAVYTLKDLSSIFFLFAVGMVATLLAFFVERVFFHFGSRMLRQKPVLQCGLGNFRNRFIGRRGCGFSSRGRFRKFLRFNLLTLKRQNFVSENANP